MSFPARKANENLGNFVHPCMSEKYGTMIECKNISIWEIRTAFHNARNLGLFTPATVELAPLAETYGKDPMINIPKDVFGIHCVSLMVGLDCSTYRLVVHPDAFRLSGKCTPWLVIDNCDLISTDFGFLTSFILLELLKLQNCHHVDRAIWSASTGPLLLTNLTQLFITNSSGLNNWTQFPHFTRGLENVRLAKNGIRIEAMNRILEWLWSFSTNSLETLWINYNSLTRIPQSLSSFNALKFLRLESQEAPGLGSIPAGALHLSSPSVKLLNLEDCGITNIEPGAIQGAIINFKHMAEHFKKIIISYGST